jgi:hypothetical protein
LTVAVLIILFLTLSRAASRRILLIRVEVFLLTSLATLTGLASLTTLSMLTLALLTTLLIFSLVCHCALSLILRGPKPRPCELFSF